MSTKKAQKTKGTIAAEKIRARANRLSDEERQQHLDRAMALIYGNGDKAPVHRR